MKVLFDHNVPHKLRRFLVEHEVFTADEMRWSSLENGRLLRVAEDAGFAVMVTGDKNLRYQQNLKGRRLALVVLRTFDWNELKLKPQPIVEAVNSASSGSFQLMT